MKICKLYLPLLVLGCCLIVVSYAESHEVKEDNDSEVIETFEPTNEWKTIRKGQAIPKGLHVRVNIQTGEKEAKLLDESDKHTHVSVKHDEEKNFKHSDSSSDHAKAIRDSLLNIEQSEEVIDEDLVKKVRERFRSYKELKEAFNKLNMTVKTDFEIMVELLNEFKGIKLNDVGDQENEVIRILTDLEYLVHQFDNAQEFVRLGGISDIVIPLLNATKSNLRSQAAHLLGSAAQSNVKVQIAALESGLLASLLKAVALDIDPIVRFRSLYALSCIIRNFPAAQGKFVKEGGLSILSEFFVKEGDKEHKLQMKAVTLIYDLMWERKDALSILSENTSNEEISMKVQQYKATDLESKIVEHGLCSRISYLLLTQNVNWGRTRRRDDMSSAMTDLPIRPEHDIVEKVTNAMLALVDVCYDDFRKDKELRDMINGLRKWYKELATKEDIIKHSKHKNAQKQEYLTSDEYETESYVYYSGISEILEKLDLKLYQTSAKDEL